ncbi:MAG: hypothetical protein K9K76_11260, partial [Halanaerobiales bacterium]|nr:hypothetical protein [Halanaerobiales bacterium]
MTNISEEVIEKRIKEVKKSDFDPSNFRLSNTGKCQRMRMLKVLGYSSDRVDQSTAETFERGNLLENWLVNQFIKNFPRKTRNQIEVYTPYGDIGHMDIWFPNPKDKPSTIIEVKSVHEKAGSNLPKKDHLNQVQAYLHFFTDSRGKRRANRAELIYIFYGRKLSTKSFEIKYNKEKGSQIEKELQRLHRWKKKGFVPEIPNDNTADSFPCFWLTHDGSSNNCPFYHHCWSQEKTEDYEDIPVFDLDITLKSLLKKYQKIKEKYKNINEKASKVKEKKKEIEAII